MERDKHPFNPAIKFAVSLLVLMVVGVLAICLFGPDIAPGIIGR